MWLEKLGKDITNMSYENNYYQGSIEHLLAAARKVITSLLVNSGRMNRMFPTMIWRNFRLKLG